MPDSLAASATSPLGVADLADLAAAISRSLDEDGWHGAWSGLGAVTQPRCIVEGDCLLITRRTLRRHFLFRPDAAMRQLYLYALGVCAAKFGVRLHAITLMSNHEHLTVTDPHGQVASFLQELHRLVALGTKVLRGWEGAVWDHCPPSVVRLLTPEAVIEKLAYTMANPVAAGLVRRSVDWPGVRSSVADLGRARWRVKRPDVYFDPNNEQWPDEVELVLELPPMLEAFWEADEIRERVAVALDEAERAARAEVKAKGWAFLGAERCLKVSPYKRGVAFEPIGARNPTFAVGRGQRAAFFAAVDALRDFRLRYRAALERWCLGDRRALFPPGSWWMRVHHAAPVGD